VESLVLELDQLFLPAKGNFHDDGITLAGVGVSYYLAFFTFSFLLAGTKDGFLIKVELRLIGIGSGVCSIVLLVKACLDLPCGFPSCSILIVWVNWLWMLSVSIVYPLVVAMRDPRFRFLRCLLIRTTEENNVDVTMSVSLENSHEEFPDYQEGENVIAVHDEPVPFCRTLSAGMYDRLKRVSLAKFLTYPAGKEAFREFTVREFAVENLLFIEAVQQHLSNPVHSQKAACALFAEYVEDSAPNQVHLPSRIVKRLKAGLDSQSGEEVCPALEEAKDHVMKALQRDVFKRFQETLAWEQTVVVFDANRSRADSVVRGEIKSERPPTTSVEAAVTLPVLSETSASPTPRSTFVFVVEEASPTPSPRETLLCA